VGPEFGRHRGSGYLYLAVGASAFMLFGGLMALTERLGPASIPIWFAAMGAAAITMRGPLGKALADRISGRLQAEQVVAQVPDEVYAELDELRARVGELEERVDFSERLLAKHETPPLS
jgi:hypothetical protein